MKCVCGYEQLDAWQTDDGKEVGDERFIQVGFGRYPMIPDKYSFDEKQADVYACPKCGTLKIDI